MAYKLTSDYGGWGTGALGAVSNPTGQINSYANVTAVSANTVTIGTANAGSYETFAVGKEIMLHVSAIISGTDYQYLGKYMLATITAVNGSTLTLSKDVSSLVASGVFANHYVQAVTVAQFDTLNLSAATISPPAFSVTNKYGGILAFKCKTALNISGATSINLAAKGIPIANVAYRPATAQETNSNQIGWENHIASRNLYMNCPDGVAFIAAKATSCTGTSARIGGTTVGVALYPYNGGSVSNTAVKGGPSILLASSSISGFDPSLISKTSSNTSGSGLGRCYIATDTNLNVDEGLYALDCLSNTARLCGLGITGFGTGGLGDVSNPSGQINSYASVSAISGKQITIGASSIGAYGGFDYGAQIMVHLSAKKTTGDNSQFGKFYVAKILGVNNSVLTVDTAAPFTISLTDYYVQIITIPSFKNLTISTSYSKALAWDDTNKYGGICAIGASGIFNLSGGQVLMNGKGLPANTERPAVITQCAGMQGDSLPISQGSGAVFVLAKTLTLNNLSRLGSSLDASSYGGSYGVGTTVSGISFGSGVNGNFRVAGDGGSTVGAWGQQANGGSGATSYGVSGSNGAAPFYSAASGGMAGTSLFVVADTIVNFTVKAFSTGGFGGSGGNTGMYDPAVIGNAGNNAGCGYSGGGGSAGSSSSPSTAYAYPGGGGGGGSAGTCFIYANTLTNPDYTAFLAA